MGKDMFDVQTDKVVLFSKGPFSQWHASKFVHEGREFSCCEQWMMYRKAVLFGDEEAARKIMATKQPKEHKALGRSVRNFRPEVWERESDKIVEEGNWLKFSQNSGMAGALLGTGEGILAEAAPWDKVWGIGLAASHPHAREPSKWKGANRLGLALMRVRARLREASSSSSARHAQREEREAREEQKQEQKQEEKEKKEKKDKEEQKQKGQKKEEEKKEERKEPKGEEERREEEEGKEERRRRLASACDKRRLAEDSEAKGGKGKSLEGAEEEEEEEEEEAEEEEGARESGKRKGGPEEEREGEPWGGESRGGKRTQRLQRSHAGARQ